MAKFTQTNEAGEEVEVEAFTQAEVDAKLQESQAAFDTQLEEKTTAMTALETAKADLEAKIEDTKEDHPNFASLKEALKEKGEALKTLQDEVTGDKKQRQDDAMGSKIKATAKGNEDVENKIKLHLSSTLASMPETTDAERQTKFDAAVKLSAEYSSDDPTILDSVMHDGGGAGSGDGGGDGGTGGVVFTANEKSLGSKLGITPEDYKKYGPKLNNK